jgi:hypothetical protein
VYRFFDSAADVLQTCTPVMQQGLPLGHRLAKENKHSLVMNVTSNEQQHEHV